MKMRHLKAENYRRQPWKNGGGFTTELMVEPLPPALCSHTIVPAGARGRGGFLWRLSIAHVEQSGPFSDFAGYERTIVLLSGDGMELDFDEAPTARIDRSEEPFVFDGGWKANCRLIGGPVKDLNLIVDRALAHAELRVVRLTEDATVVPASPCWLLYVLRGEANVRFLDLDMALARGELLRLDGVDDLPFQLRATQPDTAVVEIRIAEKN